MADYNLHGLNPRDFQHLIQAIARKAIATGVTPYGDGRDGARDLSFDGRMAYPSNDVGWDGYLVLGCKYKNKPHNDHKDAGWAIKQVDADLKKFTSARRALRAPQYYILATNIALSPVPQTGGRDRVLGHIATYAPSLGLKGYDVWDYNYIRTFIDGDADIRTAYGHFITAGDVLALLAEHLQVSRADFAQVMHTFLQKELIADMSAKLQSAGEDPDIQIPLANVFFDLPYADSAESAVLQSDSSPDSSPTVVESLLAVGASVLRRTPRFSETPRAARHRRGAHSRFVVVGGPGQGKSTITQYLCQLYRAALLSDRPSQLLEERVPGIIKQLTKQQAGAGGLPVVRRFPLRIELRTFAHALAANPALTLLEYIRQDISRLSNATLDFDDLKRWLAEYPWLLVLDGLDEVPPSSNRDAVLKEVDSLKVDMASVNCDVLMVVTTRPQSYSNEFAETSSHFYLRPLSPADALSYGRRLAAARCPGDDRRRDELVSSLEKACANAATSRLMQSPLQVTIMATLLEDTGEPPQQRYRLFLEYYRTIYRRETRRKLMGGILSERQNDIDTIHAQTGLVLHAAGERTADDGRGTPDGMDSALSDEQFALLVRGRLRQIGIAPLKVDELGARISDGSLQRLVFLVRPVEGWVRFDLTSLKEFMAAEALTTGNDKEIRDRLRLIAPTSYWRNVFQFAVGKCFVDREYLLDNIISICAALNEVGGCTEIIGDEAAARAAAAVLWGSRVALDVLSDGTARQYPGYESQLVAIALRLVRLDEYESAAQLAAIFHDDLKDLFLDAIADRLGQANVSARVGALHLLAALADRGIEWARELILRRWPGDDRTRAAILMVHNRPRIPVWAEEKFAQVAASSAPMSIIRSMHGQTVGFPAPWDDLLKIAHGGLKQVELANKSSWRDVIGKIYLTPVELGSDVAARLKGLDLRHFGWRVLAAGLRFGSKPSAESLSNELRSLAPFYEPHVWAGQLPWPLAVSMAGVGDAKDLLAVADRVAAGEFGDTPEWTEAERRWKTVGVDDSDVAAADGHSATAQMATRGFPFLACSYAGSDSFSTDQLPEMVERLRGVSNVGLRTWLGRAILGVLDFPRPRGRGMTPKVFRELYALFDEGGRETLGFAIPEDRSPHAPLDAEWVEFFDWLGRNQLWCHAESIDSGLVDDLAYRVSADPERYQGIVVVLTQFAMMGRQIVISERILAASEEWQWPYRAAALKLALARPAIGSEQIRSIVVELMSKAGRPGEVWQACRVARTASWERASLVALAFLDVIDDSLQEASEMEGYARRVLIDMLTKRPSRVQDPLIWSKLGLPERP
ncbi:MAG TPA: hypothetical protein VKZ18_14305 [Polyangia bacterium]|nr:hypothetical protein [Polyangia bacterium]